MQYKVLNEITVNGKALLSNYQYFQKQAPSCKVAPVLKADAYGHGLVNLAKFIDSSLSDVPFICVDSLYEAYELMRAGIKIDIFIMGYTFPENFKVRKKLPFIFSVWDQDSLNTLAKYQPHARIHIKLNTGMNRLGLTQSEISAFAAILKTTSLKVEGVYSHLARADDPSAKTHTNKQLKSYLVMVRELESQGLTFRWKHLAATAGVSAISHDSLNLVRLGLGFYGYSPFGPHTKEGREQRKSLVPALTLTSHIANLINLRPGDQVGYGGTYQAKQNEVIATLPLGYHEGVNRALSNSGIFMLDNVPCPVVGRVSMNMTTIKIPRTVSSRVGDPVTIIAPKYQAKNSLYQHATLANTIPYTILTSLHSSIRRKMV